MGRDFTNEFSGPVTVLELFNIIFGSPKFKTDYHIARGDFNVVVSEWDENKNRSVEFTSQFDAPLLVRKVLGKDVTTIKEGQKYRKVSDEEFIVNAQTFFGDVPFTEHYETICEWRFTKLPSGHAHCLISVHVEFKRSLFGAGQAIEYMMYIKGIKAFEDFVTLADQRIAEFIASKPTVVEVVKEIETVAAPAALSPKIITPNTPLAVPPLTLSQTSSLPSPIKPSPPIPLPVVRVSESVSGSSSTSPFEPVNREAAVISPQPSIFSGNTPVTNLDEDEFQDAQDDFDREPFNLSAPQPIAAKMAQTVAQSLQESAQQTMQVLQTIHQLSVDLGRTLSQTQASAGSMIVSLEKQLEVVSARAAQAPRSQAVPSAARPQTGFLQAIMRTIVGFVTFSPFTKAAALILLLALWPVAARFLYKLFRRRRLL